MAKVKSQAEIARMLRKHPAVLAGRRAVAEEVIDVARIKAAPHARTFRYIRGLKVEDQADGPVASATADHSRFVEAGTGKYGPKRRVIRAGAAGKAFSFVVNGHEVVTRVQRGTKPQRIMQEAGAQVGLRPGLRFTRRRPWRYTP